jgi:ribosomal-protein-alanine N-acetyltransferase
MFANWADDPDVTKYLRWKPHASVAESAEIIKAWTAQYESPDVYIWAVVIDGEPVGSIGAVDINEKAESVCIGYCLSRRFWRRGIMTEALSAVIKFFFEETGANRVESYHDPNNPNSGAVMRKAGMMFEGTRRKGDWNNQGIVDAACYAVLKEDAERASSVSL